MIDYPYNETNCIHSLWEVFVLQLIITQKPDYEFLGGPKHKGFTVNLNGESYDIDIDQIGKRTITISTTSSNYNGTLL